MEQQTPLLEVKNFSVTFNQLKKGLKETKLTVIRNLNLTIYEGEIVAVIGASGSGKSLLADGILGILPENTNVSGVLAYQGEQLTQKRQLALRGKEIALIPQSINALDPLMTVGKQVKNVINKGDKTFIQEDIFKQLGLPFKTKNKYPFELSGGMARRVLTSMAVISNAKLIIADEPTPGLDPIVLQETINNIKQLAKKGKSIMLITHDLETALSIADRVVVFNKGETIETTDVENFSGKGEKLQHPYTKLLWNALPQNGFTSNINVENKIKKNLPYIDETKQLIIKNVSYRLNNRQELFKNINFEINPGEVVGLKGPSGSGKTTLAQIIAGYRQAEQGSIKIDEGLSSRKVNPVQLVWQHPEQAINPKWKMKQVLEENGQLDQTIIDMLGIKKEWLVRWPSELSGGELQRFSIARALGDDTRYLILDEITTMLDAVTQAEIWNVILEIVKKRKLAVLAISHNSHLLDKTCHRILDFNDLNKSI